MLYVRGAAADYDEWAERGADGWSWAEVEPVFRRLEDFDGADPVGVRGHGGPVHVQSHPRTGELTRGFVDAAIAAGVPGSIDSFGYHDSRPLGLTPSSSVTCSSRAARFSSQAQGAVLTGANDTLAPEGAALAATVRTAGTHVEHHRYPGVNHDFIAGPDRDVVHDALDRVASFLAPPGTEDMPR